MVELHFSSFLIFQRDRHFSPFPVPQSSFSESLIKEGHNITPQLKERNKAGAIVMEMLIFFLPFNDKQRKVERDATTDLENKAVTAGVSELLSSLLFYQTLI